jgi:hypothetical protein
MTAWWSARSARAQSSGSATRSSQITRWSRIALAREDVATTLERRGVDATEIAAALERLEAAPLGALVEVGRGVAIRHGAVTAFLPELGSSDLVPEACLAAVA